MDEKVPPPARQVRVSPFTARWGNLDSQSVAVRHFVEPPSICHMPLPLEERFALHRRPLELFEIAKLETALAVDIRLQTVSAE